MKAKRPVLSISILISGRKEMRKCLESLKPFLEELPCELILVDTGCNEDQLAIAKEYTEIIIPFTWCNDFSAARNTGLKKAKGEWFMYLDDDEWFEDPSEIISFFQSGEYKKFNGAYYKVRNHVDYSGNNYVDHFVTRMVKMEQGTWFKGKIHEVLKPLYAPLKTLDTHVEHYGYAFATEEERKKHSLRNIPPLLEEVKEKPDEMRWYGQLAQEYLGNSDYGKGAEISLKGIRRYEAVGDGEEDQYCIYAALYCFALANYLRMDDYAEAEKILEKGLGKFKGTKPYRAYLLQGATAVFWESKRYSDCINAAKEYLQIYDKIADDEKLIAREGFLIAQGAFQESLYVSVLLRASLAAAREAEYDALEYFFFKPDWQNPRMSGQQELEKDVIEAMLKTPYQESFSRMMKTMGERDGGMAELYPILLEIEKTCRQNEEDEKLERLWRLVSEIESEHLCVKMAKIYCQDKRGDREGIIEILHEILKKEENVLDVREDVWKVVEKNQISLEPFFMQMDFGKWRRALGKWVYIAPFEEAAAWETRCEAWDCKNDIRYMLLKIRCKEIMIRQKGLDADIETLEKQLAEYAEEVLAYYHLFYKEEIFTVCPEVLPDEARVSLHYLNVIETRKLGDGRSVIKALREMIDIYPFLEEVTLHYAKMLRDEVERQNKEAETARSELEVLVYSLKIMARSKIVNKEYQAAKEILSQIQSCLPGDEEVQDLIKQVEET